MVERNDTAVTNDHTDLSDKNFTCPVWNVTDDTIQPENQLDKKSIITTQKFDWSEEEIGYVQSAYFVGYISTMIIGANIIIQGFGFYRGCLLLLVLSTLSLLIFPLMTQLFGLYGAIGLRFLLGATHGPCTSLVAYSWYLWVLPYELTTANTISNLGAGAGAVGSMVISGQLLEVIGWVNLHYVIGGISVAIVMLWFLFADDAPEQETKQVWRPFSFSNQISDKERQLIVENRPSKRSGKKLHWAKMFSSMNVWLFSAAWFLITAAYITMNLLGMRYAVYISQIPLKVATGYGSIAALVSFPTLMGFAMLSDCTIKNGISSSLVRKCTFTLFTIISILSILPMIIYPCNMTIVLLCMMVSSLSMGTVLTISTKPIPNEMAGEYSGQLYAFSNTLGNISGVISKFAV